MSPSKALQPRLARRKVKSSNLASVGYDPKSRQMEIEFKNGSIYRYYRVPAGMWRMLMRASSKGRFHYRYIRMDYQYRRLRPPTKHIIGKRKKLPKKPIRRLRKKPPTKRR